MNNIEIKKIDNFTAQVIETPVVEPIVTTYNLDTLKDREATILKGINDYVTNHKGELDRVRALIAQLQDLGLQSKAEVQAAEVEANQAKVDSIDIQ